METIKKIAVILVLTLLCFAGCDSDLSGVSGVETDNQNPYIVIALKNGTIETYEYTGLSYSNNRNVLTIITETETIVKLLDEINIFYTSETNQHIVINVIGSGDVSLQYNKLYFNDRNVLSVIGSENSYYYGIGLLNNFTTTQ